MFRNKKWIIISVLAVVNIVIVAVVVCLIFDKDETNNQSASTRGGIVQLNQNKNAGDSISLEPKATQQNDPNTLSVTDSASSSTNLGSGNGQQTNSSSSSAKKEDFSQYEQYKDKNEIFFGEIAVGNGPEAVKDKQLAVTYTGYLTSGQVFDQSRPANNGQLQPLLFTLGAGQLIPGFEMGVNGMKVGGVRRVIIPPSLGYGDKAQGDIPANSVLIFDISLTAAQ